MTYPLTAIISDLHGNIPAVTVALDDARARGVERFVCLGDVVGYGAQPAECLDLVMKLCVEGAVDAGRSGPEGGPLSLVDGICLQGNHEHALMNSAEDFNPKARAAIEWTKKALWEAEGAEAKWDFVGELEPSARDEVAMYAHGSPRDPVREYMLPRDRKDEAKLAANFALMDRGVCFVGHSHVPFIYFRDGSWFKPEGTDGPYRLEGLDDNPAIINVGSVGQPRDGDNRLSYVIFNGTDVTFVRLEYDIAAAADAIRNVPELPDFLADRLEVGK